ncbi:MAG: cytochrome C [Candidatus Eremiobacteraeota bacterium]|nr:cytochrome C [Candidatus Eremiobacteraeota bacterium]
MKPPVLAAALVLTASLAAAAVSSAGDSTSMLERGKLLVTYGGCNDCHTPGWQEADGRIAVSHWMTGSSIGFKGRWGVSYPANVRLLFQEISEDQWLFSVRTRGGHPPMHWTDLRALSTDDQRAIYRFIHSLGPAGTVSPAAVPPWETPKTPVIDTVPH